ncbi:BON domain-containing protein [Ideonella sp. DXS29W]|uniref:BON domain-containing protein n=1 Tax=Ideonella lacteola TaxID=2984193 RepID=A0ABU9BM85_9BURK
MTKFNRRYSLLATLALATATSALTSACAPLLIGGAMASGALLYTDRRTSGAQLEDQAIEFKAGPRLKEALGERAHLNVTSYNRLVLITGEVASEADREAAEKTVAAIENVRTTVNESAVMGLSSLTARSNDALITSKVKAAFIDNGNIQANAIKVVTERSTVYLMGRVTDKEADKAAEIARTVSGVQKVVKVFELISDAELKALESKK